MLALKTRNPIIFGFHPFAQKSCVETGRIIRDAAIAAGALRIGFSGSRRLALKQPTP